MVKPSCLFTIIFMGKKDGFTLILTMFNHYYCQSLKTYLTIGSLCKQ